jgi:hypothetical protein
LPGRPTRREIGAGKTYAQLSTEAMALPPTSARYTAVEAQVQTVFRGDTLRSMLLNAFSWWKVSQIAYIVSLIAFGLATFAVATGLYGFVRAGYAREAQVKVFDHTTHEVLSA